MSKMKPYRNFKVSIDYRLKASIDFYRPQETKASIDFQWQSKTWHFLRSSERLNRGVPSGVGYVCLGVQISKGIVHRQPRRLCQSLS